MSSERLAISVHGLSKAYRLVTALEHQASPTLVTEAIRQGIKGRMRRTKREMFHALSDLEFDVHEGEAVGIIGRNGAGKSTFLKVLSRVTTPTSGRIDVYGRVGSLLEVGTGFHAELTGRENVWLNGALLGMRRAEIARAFDSIVEFAQVDRFLETPVKRYSSGMYVRLAFAVAAHLKSEILLVDEVLAVGDADFQKKCIGKMGDVSTDEGRTVLFVSHQMVSVQAFCKRTIYLREGRLAFDGPTPEAIDRYLGAGDGAADRRGGVFELSDVARPPQAKYPVLRRVEIRDQSGQASDSVAMGEDLSLVLHVEGLTVPRHYVVVIVKTETELKVLQFNTLMKPPAVFDADAPQDRLVLTFPRLPLAPGRYYVELVVSEGGISMKHLVDRVERAATFEVLAADVFGTGYQIQGPPNGGVCFVDAAWEVESDGVITAQAP